jgi:predicted AlkP superfamily pyrophosphatase or phosphodiesterase
MCKINKKKVVVYATLSSNLHNKLIADMKTPLIIRFFILFTLIPCLVFGQKSAVERPKLVVGIVVDQMRWDYLYRFADRFGKDGFVRLLKQGYSNENCMINYLPAFTAPGHSCIYTGSVPALHGIAGNDWIDNRTLQSVYCTEDKKVLPIGGSKKAGQMSPENLLATTITDELRLATNKQSKVFGFSLKDRGSILPAGHMSNGSFWLDDSTGNFMTSTYYMNELPNWLQAFNAANKVDSFLALDWNTYYPISTYQQSLADQNAFEGLFKGESTSAFPHITHTFIGKDKGIIRKIPAGNSLTLQVAATCIKEENLGTSNTDFLCISLSSTDYIGHQYAPNSVETEDTYIRLDKDIASFLQYLDKTIGKGEYLVFLTADHGAAQNANYLKSQHIPAGIADEKESLKELKNFLIASFGKDSMVLGLENYQVVFNESYIADQKMDRNLVRSKVMEWARNQASVQFAIDLEQIQDALVPASIKEKVINGYNTHRSGSIQLLLNPAWYDGHSKTGTTHGTWNPYDAHIPLLWYGWHIPKGSSNKEVYMTDISATLASLLHIQMPNACIGKPIFNN